MDNTSVSSGQIGGNKEALDLKSAVKVLKQYYQNKYD